MKQTMYVVGIIIALLIGFTVHGAVKAIRVAEVAYEVGTVGQTVNVFKFTDKDTKATCFMAQRSTQYQDTVSISCVK